jgi:hypothetical protein
MPKKLTYEFVKEQFENEGYRLLSYEYISSGKKLDYRCPEGHNHSITWDGWKADHRCPYCYGNEKPTYQFVKKQFEREGYTLLSEKYVNNHTKLRYRCFNNHEHSVTWNSWKCLGSRCPHCYGNAKLNIEFIRSEFKKEGYKLLAKNYKNSKQKLSYICPKGHKHSITWGHWCSGKRCRYCYGNPIVLISKIKEVFEQEKYILLSTKYEDAHQKLEYICSMGHRHNITWNSWQQGQRCPTCALINNSGENHYNWKGGITCEPYCQIWLDKEFKESIKKRDNYQCQNPDCWGTNKKLTVHHIDYDKKNCSKENLITLCNSCNTRANFNREYWQELYSSLLYRKIMKRRSNNEFSFSDKRNNFWV